MIKKEKDQVHHFRATVGDHWVSVIEGVFYNWLEKYSCGCGDHVAAIKMQEQMVQERLADGFYITTYVETSENTLDVYDKAKWHFGGEFPSDLDPFQGYIHTGLFLGWLIDNNLMSDEFTSDNEEVFSLFNEKKMTGPRIFESHLDGVLKLEDISEIGNRFALSYFDFNSGQYLGDYERALFENLPSMYHVEDSWENYGKLKSILDKRLDDWKNSDKNRPF